MIDLKLILEYSKDVTVLYIEDDKELQESTQKLLNNYFKYVDTADDGQQGLEQYRDYKNHMGNYYDLVISDIRMPHLDGLEMGWSIIKENPLQSIVIFSAFNDTYYLEKFLQMGVSGFMEKPLNLKQLEGLIFKVSKAIFDAKLVNRHYETIETLNIQLESKNSELEKSLRAMNGMISRNIHAKDKEVDRTEADIVMENSMFQDQIDILIENDLGELTEYLDAIDFQISKCKRDYAKDNLVALSYEIKSYSSTISTYTFFDNVSKQLKALSLMIENEELPDDKEAINNIFIYMESFVYVLGKWQNAITVSSLKEINYFDESIISDINLIMQHWREKEQEYKRIEFF